MVFNSHTSSIYQDILNKDNDQHSLFLVSLKYLLNELRSFMVGLKRHFYLGSQRPFEVENIPSIYTRKYLGPKEFGDLVKRNTQRFLGSSLEELTVSNFGLLCTSKVCSGE